MQCQQIGKHGTQISHFDSLALCSRRTLEKKVFLPRLGFKNWNQNKTAWVVSWGALKVWSLFKFGHRHLWLSLCIS